MGYRWVAESRSPLKTSATSHSAPVSCLLLRSEVWLVVVLASTISTGVRVKHFVGAAFALFWSTPHEQPPVEAAPKSSQAPLPERLRCDERVTLLVLAYNGTAGDGAYLTNSMALASFNTRIRTMASLAPVATTSLTRARMNLQERG